MSDAVRHALDTVSLDDKYTLERGRAFMSGTQALVRLPMLQRERDRRQGLNTAGFISGYRGSPLGGLDQALWKAGKHLAAHHVVFQPGINEDLAATSVWGSQQVNLWGKSRYDGVFAMWYGKGPGVDRSGDVFKHANAAGTSPHGGVIALAGDDHGAKSSTLPHQSDHIFKACGLPVFYPASVQEYLDLGLHGWAMSRWSGLWVAMKTVTEVVEASASVMIDPDRVDIRIPRDFPMPDDPHGLNIRWPDTPLAQEARLLDYKFYAALTYVRENRLNHVVFDSPHAWFGIITAGKAYLDTRQALEDLGLDRATCERIGIRLFKCGVVWPLEAQTTREFATGLEEILVVEEKRQLIEYALKEELYNYRDDVRPRIYGKFDERDGQGGEWAMPMGRWLLPAHYELSPAIIAKAIAGRLLNPGQYGSRFEMPSDLRARIEARLAIIAAKESAGAEPQSIVSRVPTFCSGCPHNTSTRVPEGSRAVAGIGCHYMTTWMPDRRTETFTQMGGEGTTWIGQAPFTDEKHIFANLGDGTYFHSGFLAVRASIAAGVNITYKILFNDAVAMTGGQPVDGSLTVPQIVAELQAEGARKIVICTDDPDKYDALKKAEPALAGIEVHHRDHLDWLQRELREIPGCTILIYEQTCASEKRRRRKKIVDGKPGYPDPARRVVINDAVCEGCGDCSVQSSCVSVEPLETEFGRKRTINQSSCNKDYSCLKGFCPSFVTVEGGRLRKGRPGLTSAVIGSARAAAAGAAAGELARSAANAAAVAGGGAGVGAGTEAGAAGWKPLPEPALLPLGHEGHAIYGILVTGVGGTGVVTIGQLLGMAAHLQGIGVSVLDMAGLAQKGGAVFSHVQIAARPEDLHATRIATGEADLLIGSDLVVSAGAEALSKLRRTVTRAVINDDVAPTSDFLRNPDWALPADSLKRDILAAAGEQEIDFVEATELAVALMGDTLMTNLLLLGYAWQKGWVPLQRVAIERAIELNGVAVDANRQAFEWGRRLADDPTAVRRAAGLDPARSHQPAPTPVRVIEFKRPNRAGVGTSMGVGVGVGVGVSAGVEPEAGSGAATLAQLDALIARRVAELTAYQSRRYAKRYAKLVERVRTVESERIGAGGANGGEATLPLTEAVARFAFKLMAYKDEYEVARLHADPAFQRKLAEQFEGDYTLRFHLAPPLLSRVDPKTGRPRKRSFGPWILPVFRVLAHGRRLRGTPFDVFGHTEERRLERQLIRDYRALVDEIVTRLTRDNHAACVSLARLPDGIRGYGLVKDASIERVQADWRAGLASLRGELPPGHRAPVVPIKAA
ncbi:MAG: indolepyruvate ferredoxin oxidoreductase family protein [Burkholderiaceae bacterium]